MLCANDVEAAMRGLCVPLAFLCGLAAVGATAADRFFAYNHTTATDFTGLFLAPEGSNEWGANQALNDRDHTWESGERLPMTGVSRGRFDLKIVDRKGRACIRHGVDLTKDTTFDLRDEDLVDCGK
jgi:hypothetical protein